MLFCKQDKHVTSYHHHHQTCGIVLVSGHSKLAHTHKHCINNTVMKTMRFTHVSWTLWGIAYWFLLVNLNLQRVLRAVLFFGRRLSQLFFSLALLHIYLLIFLCSLVKSCPEVSHLLLQLAHLHCSRLNQTRIITIYIIIKLKRFSYIAVVAKETRVRVQVPRVGDFLAQLEHLVDQIRLSLLQIWIVWLETAVLVLCELKLLLQIAPVLPQQLHVLFHSLRIQQVVSQCRQLIQQMLFSLGSIWCLQSHLENINKY